MADNDVQIDFNAPAILRKWPSLNAKRLSETRYSGAYLVVEGTLLMSASRSSWQNRHPSVICTKCTRGLSSRS